MNSPRFLILSASTGNGHLSAAKALEDEFKDRGLCVASEDVLDHCPKAFRAWYAGGYENLVRNSPGMWGHLYRTSDRPLFNFWFQTGLDWAFCSGLANLIGTFKPTWVICTHSLPQPRLATLQRSFHFKTAVVVTDLHPHLMWLRGTPDQFFVPVPETKTLLEKRLPSSQGRIHVVGMPIHRAFVPSPKTTGNSPIKVLLAAGGIGGGPIEETATALAQLPIELTVVAGRHDQLKTRLDRLFNGNDQVQIHGFLPQEKFAALLSSADILVSKPGGLTTFESLACGTAFVIVKELLIPGQEEENARLLERIGAGKSVAGFDNVASLVRTLIESPEELKSMQAAALSAGRPKAARHIVDLLSQP